VNHEDEATGDFIHYYCSQLPVLLGMKSWGANHCRLHFEIAGALIHIGIELQGK